MELQGAPYSPKNNIENDHMWKIQLLNFQSFYKTMHELYNQEKKKKNKKLFLVRKIEYKASRELLSPFFSSRI